MLTYYLNSSGLFTLSYTMKTLVRLVLVSVVLLVVDNSPVLAQSEADAIGSAAAAPATSAAPVRSTVPKYADASIGFEFEYKVDNAAVCVVWPEELQDAGCDGLDYHNLVAYAVASKSSWPRIRSLAYLRFENDANATISVVHAPSTKTFISQGEIDDLLDEYLAGLKMIVPATLTMSGSAPGSRYDTTEINGVDALRFKVTANVPRGSPGYSRCRAVGYVLFGKHGQVMISAKTDPDHIGQTRVALESIVKTVRLPQLAQKEIVKTFPLVRLMESEFGLFLLVLIVTTLLSVQSYFARQNRKKRSPQR